MILKVASVQPVVGHPKQDPWKTKDGLNKKKSTSFANILEDTIKSKSNGK